MKIIIAALALLIAPQFVLAQNLAAQRSQAQEVAAKNGAANPSNIAGQLAEAFGTQQNTEALLSKAKQLAQKTPAEVKAIAAAAAVFNPAAAARIAAELATMFPAQAAAIAAAVAAAVPSQAVAIASAVSAAVPAEATNIANAISASSGSGTTTTSFPGTTQFTTQNPANFSGGQATPAPTPPPVSPSN